MPSALLEVGFISRYFFNIYNGESIFDDVGTDLASAREMRLHMIATALTLFEDEENQKLHWKMEALDEAGRIVGTMAFGVVDEESSV